MLERLYSWYGKRTVWTMAGAIAVLLIVASYFSFFASNEAVVIEEIKKPEVTLSAVGDINFESTFSTVGIVEAVSEAQLQTEAGGRITSINTEIGKTVSAGTVIATIENNSQQATLLQAQGAYEAAVAGAASGGITIESAQENLTTAINSAITTFQNNYITIDTLLHNEVDDLFLINNGLASGIRIDAQGQAPVLNEERNSINALIDKWSFDKNTVNNQNIESLLDEAKTDVLRFSQFVDVLTTLVSEEKVSSNFTQTEKDTLQSTLTATRLSLNSVLQQIEASDASIISAKNALEQARLAGSQNTSSAASAQVKIALGSLRSAQANLEKTLVRTPITGVVNALYLKAGDYVSPGQPAATIANNDGLEIVTSVNEDDKDKLSIGQAVVIDKTSTGVITAIAGAVDPTTGKISVKVSVDPESKLKNGSTVALEFTQSEQKESFDIIVPLSAIKMTGSGPVAFKANNNILEAIPLTLGAIKGDSVVVTEGLTKETIIVLDARGLKAGEEVVVTK